VHSTFAGTTATATITPPNTAEFPHLVAYLDVHDPTGGFVHGLNPQDVTLLENNLQIPVSDLQELKPGVQFVIAITPGESFIIRDGLGVSRYEYLLQNILGGTWAAQPPDVDDLSLITMGGPQVLHVNDPAALRSSLEGYKPAVANALPSLEVLASALQVASDPTGREGMERAILFITPPQSSEVSLGLQSIIASANQQNIHIFVWLVASQEVFELPETDLLRNLAEQTQGSFFAFDHDEPVPDLESIQEPLRYIYQVKYESQVTTAGSQQVSAQVMVGNEPVVTQPQVFDLSLQAPEPSFLSLPAEIDRLFSSQPTPGAANLETDLIPIQKVINFQVTFPDGYDRPLASSSLYIDGALYAENTTSPFDQFVWDLRTYTKEGVHTISVEVIDNLGLAGKSGQATVKITVPSSTRGVLVTLSQKRPLLVGSIVLLSASILVLVLILGGRIQPKPHPGQVKKLAGSADKTRPAGFRERRRQDKDPVTQPLKIAPSPSVRAAQRIKAWKDRIPWLKKEERQVAAMAYLLPLAGTGEATIPAPLKITTEEVTLGRDPMQANLVVTDPSIEPLHARIHFEGNLFTIFDAGSIAGTWVNFKQVQAQGTQLEHADIIHLGGIVFRFTLAEPGPLRKIVVTHLESEQ
jgi:hypothetical protein